MKKLEMPGLREMIEVEKVTQREAARRLGCCVSAIERRCQALGLRTQRTGPRSGKGHPNWKGGRQVSGEYIYLHAPDHPHCTGTGYVLEHRLVMEKKLGRYLKRSEVVHHIDGDRQNNRLSNLIVFQTNGHHLRHELSGRKRNEEGKLQPRKARSRKGSKSGGDRRTRKTARRS